MLNRIPFADAKAAPPAMSGELAAKPYADTGERDCAIVALPTGSRAARQFV